MSNSNVKNITVAIGSAVVKTPEGEQLVLDLDKITSVYKHPSNPDQTIIIYDKGIKKAIIIKGPFSEIIDALT